MTTDALLEIGTEELPFSYIEPATRQMADMAKEFLSARGLPYSAVTTYATPRRLALSINGLAEKSEDRAEEFQGPAVKVGKDAQGNFTMAAKGFAARHGIEPEALKVKTTDKGEYFCALKKTPGEKAERLVRELFTTIITRLYFPKTMKWEATQFRFARPVRSLVTLYGAKVMKCAIADVKSGNKTTGLHALNKKKIAVTSAERYRGILKNNCVIADPEERLGIVRKTIEAAAKRVKGVALEDDALLNEVNYLVEHPVAVLGRFDEKYLKLPREVLITCMKKKQKYFPINDDKGRLTNSFIGVRNGVSEHQEIVREGYERVLAARLADAEFFFHQDTRTPLSAKSEKLGGVLLHEKLGTISAKVARVNELASYINGILPAGAAADPQTLERASSLSKADLVTEMVFEYPELQGAVGRIYAAHDGETPEVSAAVEQHYWPLSAEGKLPEGPAAAVLSLADKFDTLAGDFAIGLIPTGSADPYGLRRMSGAIIRIIRERRLPLSLRNIVEKSLSLFPDTVSSNTAAKDLLLDFFRQRLENILEAAGCRFDEIRAVTAGSFDDIVDTEQRLAAVKLIRTQPDFEPLAGAFKRAANILKQARKMNIDLPASFDEALALEPAEKDLYVSVKQMEQDARKMIDAKDYAAALTKMVGIKPLVDEFFDKIMVMADDAKVRANRLALLDYTTKLFFRILDFSLLQ